MDTQFTIFLNIMPVSSTNSYFLVLKRKYVTQVEAIPLKDE